MQRAKGSVLIISIKSPQLDHVSRCSYFLVNLHHFQLACKRRYKHKDTYIRTRNPNHHLDFSKIHLFFPFLFTSSALHPPQVQRLVTTIHLRACIASGHNVIHSVGRLPTPLTRTFRLHVRLHILRIMSAHLCHSEPLSSETDPSNSRYRRNHILRSIPSQHASYLCLLFAFLSPTIYLFSFMISTTSQLKAIFHNLCIISCVIKGHQALDSAATPADTRTRTLPESLSLVGPY